MRNSFPSIPLVDLRAQYLSIKAEVDEAIASVLHSGRFIGGEEVKTFASEFSTYHQTKYTIPCANGTDAIEIALQSLGIGPGDEVILPALTFVATLEAVCNTGASPVICDIDPGRYTLDAQLAITLVTDRTKAFLPVHLYGLMADLDPLIHYAADHHMFLIEDAAQAHGATYKGRKAGSIGDINTFSFYPGKNLGAYGDAGAMTTSSEWLFEKATKLADHGRTTKYDHEIIGRNSRMDALQAAILKVKLDHLDEWTTKRQEVAARYRGLLHGVTGIHLPEEYPDSEHVYHLFVVRVHASIRGEFINYLHQKGIETGIHYPIALSRLKVTTVQLGIDIECPQAEKASREVVSLPIYPELTHEDQDYICDTIKAFFNA